VSNVKATLPSNSITAAFDLGSNTIKMTVGRDSGNGHHVEEILSRSETVRLGQGIEQSGELAQDRMTAALDTLRQFSNEARNAGATRLIGVATEATRVARNGRDFLDRVHAETGIEIKTITGQREAELTFLGLDGAVDLDGDVVVADIGGGSTELIVARDRVVEWSQSFAVGSGRLTDRFVTHDPPTAAELESCREEAARVMESAPLERSRGGRLIVVGGTGEYLDRLIPDETTRDPEALDGVIERLLQIPAEDLAALLAIQLARARVLPAGVAIAAGVSDLMEPASFEAAQSGIRRGLLLKAFAGEL
jgi:exopolyphosphatase/guanosine-5'-triphosphate,3'-diphosphate pyrophosphatase